MQPMNILSSEVAGFLPVHVWLQTCDFLNKNWPNLRDYGKLGNSKFRQFAFRVSPHAFAPIAYSIDEGSVGHVILSLSVTRDGTDGAV